MICEMYSYKYNPPPALVILKHQNRGFDWRLALVCPCWVCGCKIDCQSSHKAVNTSMKLEVVSSNPAHGIFFTFKFCKLIWTEFSFVRTNTETDRHTTK